jgi:uncharacterized phage protein (TIGR01671 family)
MVMVSGIQFDAHSPLEKPCIIDEHNDIRDLDEVELMLFTGLCDKNGKEICESDIVKCGYGVGEVIFQAGCFMVQWIDDKEAYLEFVFSRKGMYARKNDEQFEIIGNIYEKIK